MLHLILIKQWQIFAIRNILKIVIFTSLTGNHKKLNLRYANSVIGKLFISYKPQTFKIRDGMMVKKMFFN